MRQTTNFENNKPLLLVEENHNMSLKKRCSFASCLLLTYGMFYGLGFYSGYLMNKYDCDGSL